MSKRATQAELIQRRKEIQELILQGVNSIDIQEAMSEKWSTSKRAICEDMRHIKAEWKETEPEERQQAKNEAIEGLRLLLNKALQEGHIKTALDIRKEINKLQGLYNESDKEDSKMPEFIQVKRRSQLKVVGDNGDNE